MKIGVDIGGSHVAVGVVNRSGKILELSEIDYTEEEKKSGNLIKIAENYIINEIDKLKNNYKIESIGIAVPGTISNGIILKSVNLGVEKYDLKKNLELILKLRISIRNDAKCAALAESKYGKNADKNNILFLSLGTGIGGAYISNGNLITGSDYDGFEFGHIILRPGGIKCNCGKFGCFEKYGSILSFKRKCIESLNLSYDVSGPDLRKYINENMNQVKGIIDEYIADLALGISNLINIFEPDVTIIGGGFARYEHFLLDSLKRKIIDDRLLFNLRDEVNIDVASLGNDAGIVGATLNF